MRIFISKKPETLARFVGRSTYDAYLGCMMVPPQSSYITNMDIVWGMDNGRFVCLDFDKRTWHPDRWDRDSFMRMIERKRDIPGNKFVVAPDVLLNAQATTTEYQQWHEIIREQGYPVAYSIQDGITHNLVPWDTMDALFVGGSNKVKFSKTCRAIVHEAKARGMWVHWGRASTAGFINYAKTIGCDSVDSSAFARFTNKELPTAIQLLKHNQLALFDDWSINQ